MYGDELLAKREDEAHAKRRLYMLTAWIGLVEANRLGVGKGMKKAYALVPLVDGVLMYEYRFYLHAS